MPLIYNGTEVDSIIYNGVNLDRLIYNGVVVWESGIDYSIIEMTVTAYRSLTLQITKNDATPTEIYLNDELKHTYTIASSKDVSLTLPTAGTYQVKITGGSFYFNDDTQVLDYNNLITKIILGSNYVGALGSYTLDGANQLAEIKFQTDGINAINELAFRSCNKLESVYIPESVKSIGRNAFYNCSALTNATIRATDCQLSALVFRSCAALANLYIYTQVEQSTKINSYSTSWVTSCPSTVTIHLPQSIGTIENARTLFGNYFNYTASATQCTVSFDL